MSRINFQNSKSCADILFDTFTHEKCNAVNSTCTVNSTTACEAKSCTNAPTKDSFSACNGWLSTCTWNGSTACDTIAATCGDQNSSNCYQSSAGACVVSGSTCVAYAKTCANAVSPKNFADCQSWLSTCTWTGSACTTISGTCAGQTTGSCYQATEGECVDTGSACVKFTDCANKSAPANNAACLAYSSTCAIAPVGGCQDLNTCASYKTSLQCVKSTSKDCYWNATAKTCVDLTCANIEQSNAFSTHTNCATITNSNSQKVYCTVRSNADNSNTALGCTDLQDACTSYKISQQCVNDKAKKLCEWVTVGTASSCAYKTCTTAPSSTKTHTDCNQYYSDTNVKCTVNATKAADGTITLSGCIQTAACNTYIDKEQCQKNDKGVDCGWNGTKCDDYSCATADPSVNTDHDKCNTYLNTCTVTDTDAGCIDLPATCEELKTKNNCKINKAGDDCYWDEANTKCITPTCANAPQSYIDDTKCEDYLDTCTQDKDIPCKTLVCEDFAEKTDDACKAKLPNNACTTDGTKCVKRGICQAALVESACTFNSALGLCQWDSTNNNCADMNCGTAPVATYTSDTQCAGYYIAKKCMLKSGGGCTNRVICTSIKVQEACTNSIGDVNQAKCSWDAGNCRYQNCTDFSGTTHADCQTKYVKGQCTAGANSKCAAVTTCTNTTIQAACVYGSDGPCLWVSGKCYAYKKCQSISFLTDPLCKVISSNCSVDTSLNKCVPITTCGESNINGGCVTGYDGECIMSKNDNGKICKVKQSCADAAFQTDDDCQAANTGCTTDGTTCVELGDCSTYKSELGCVRNKSGPSDTITGYCNWDATAKTCHDETCSEIATGVITTHLGCYSQLKKCSSNGTKCVDQQTCDKYEIADVPCNAAKGTDQLPCYYEAASATNNNVASCRTKKCADITDLTVCAISGLSCVSDGTKCIAKATCSSYTAKAACNAGGTDGDGICVWKAGTTTGTCSKVTSCATADQDACGTTFMKNYCYWKTTTTGTTSTSACAPHTCASYQAYSNSCSSFKVYGGATQQICALDTKNICAETDPKTLPEGTCFSSSNYVYTWNGSCQQCKGGSVQPGNNSSTGNDTNTTTDSGYILGFASIIFGYALF